jgi:predicted helicase
LYIYPNEQQIDLFNQIQNDKKPNIDFNLYKKLNKNYSNLDSRNDITPEQIQNYIYSILFSNIYREIYFDFLKIDFPRIPFTANYNVFLKLAVLGQRLIKLHLLNSPDLAQPTVKFQGEGEDMVIGRRKYDEATQRVYINKDYYFEGVKPEVWEYQIGGYQVMDKYLKDRKGRRMEDPRHYIHIATALAKTIEIQEQIDAIYPEVEKDLIEF